MFIFNMNQLDIGRQEGKTSIRKCWEEGSYSIIIVLVGICLLNVYQLASYDFQAEDILYDLKEWSNSQATKKQLDHVLQVSEAVKDLMSQLGNMIDQEDFLLVKIKEYYIDDNREEKDIPDIVDFQKKLGKYKHIQIVKEEEYKKIMQKVNRLKFQQGKHIVQEEEFALFYGQARSLSQQLSTFREVLKQIVDLNKKWYNEEYKKISKEPQQNNTIISQQDIEDLPEYNNLPPLAQEVLRPRPIQLLKQLYKSTSTLHQQSQLQMRQKFMKEREYLARQFRLLQSFSLSKYNIRSGIEDKSWETDIIGDYPRLNAKFSLQQVKSELGFCIVVPTYNNFNNFRAELNLNSIFSQNYTNYKVVIIDDASKDDTALLIQKYLNYYKIAPERCELIVNKVNKKALENIYNAIVSNCNGYDIITIVDGDDELVGFNTLKVLNSVYSRQKLGVVYSNFFYYYHNSFQIRLGFNQEYTQKDKENYRKAQQKFSHLISFKRQLFLEIKLQDLQQNGHFYHVAYDFAMIYPLMELSCGKVKYINEYQYLYSIGTGMNDYQLLSEDQKNIGKQILDRPAYECSEKYKK